MESTVHPTNTWLQELCEELGGRDRQRARHALRTILHALRDRRTVAGGHRPRTYAGPELVDRGELLRLVGPTPRGAGSQGRAAKRDPAKQSSDFGKNVGRTKNL
jgi:hypothetical protein